MNIAVARVVLLILSLGLGVALAFVLVNRWLIRLRQSWQKSAILLLTPVVVAGIFGVAALRFPPPIWSRVVFVGLVVLLLGEARRLYLRRRYAASQPLHTRPHRVSLRRPLTTTDIAIHRYAIEFEAWQGPPLRIAHLSDLHVTQKLPADYYRRALLLARETSADLIFFTGDFVTRPNSLSVLVDALRLLNGREAFAVLGNHDYWMDPQAVRGVLSAAGVQVLADEWLRYPVAGQSILIAGSDFPWSRRELELPPCQPGELRLVLSHTPDNIYRFARQSAHCVFAGHFHAGQFRLPFMGPVIVPSSYGRRFDHGHFMVNGTHLFVAGGVGVAMPPLRLYCQPDILVVEIRGGGNRRSQGDAASSGSAAAEKAA